MTNQSTNQPAGVDVLSRLKSEVLAWIQGNEVLLMNERDMQVRIAKHLEDCGLFDSVITEYGVPLSELEARRPGIVGSNLFPWDNDISVDIVVEKEGRFAALELKYTTREVSTHEETIFGEEAKTDDVKTLKNHAATNIRMYDFWKDVRRIEMLRETFENVDGGLVLMITNNHTFWDKAKDSAKYRNFSMEAEEMVGQSPMTWNGDVAQSIVKSRPDFRLEGLYTCQWDNTQIKVRANYPFRYMIAEINANSVNPWREKLQKTLDLSHMSDGRMDHWLAKEQELIEYYPQKTLSILIIDPDNHMPLSKIKELFPKLTSLYFDLSQCTPGDLGRIGKKIYQYIVDGEFTKDGLLLDNVDQIHAGDDTENLEEIVWQALKRDNSEGGGYEILRDGKIVSFDKMMIAVRCKEYPEYLRGKSLQYYIIEV